MRGECREIEGGGGGKGERNIEREKVRTAVPTAAGRGRFAERGVEGHRGGGRAERARREREFERERGRDACSLLLCPYRGNYSSKSRLEGYLDRKSPLLYDPTVD